MIQITENFREAMYQAGLNFSGEIISDGKLHRFRPEGDTHGNNGWYILHNDNNPVGVYGDWRRDISKTWSAKLKNDMSQDEWIVHRNRLKELQYQRELEIKKRHAVAATEAKKILAFAQPVTANNIAGISYLVKKQVQSYGLFYLPHDVQYEVYPKEQHPDGTELIHTVFAGTLLIPIYDTTTEIVNLERIYFFEKRKQISKTPSNWR